MTGVDPSAARARPRTARARPRITRARPPTAPAGPTVRIGPRPLRVEDVVAVAAGAPVELFPEAVARIEAGRAVVERYVAGDELVYGLNTGLGHMRDQRLSIAELVDYQDAIVAAHASAIGPALPTAVVRAAMLARVAGIAIGGSGASLAVAEALVAMLNAGVHPIVPETGSVGASDLMHMAAIGEVALGRGRAEYRGAIMPGADALRAAGLATLALGPKDGLALISANGVSIGRGALVADRAADVADLADVALVASLEATGGNVSIVDPAVAAAKGIAGQTAAADHIRALLHGSELCRPSGAASVQDPLSFRVGPQVHGALRELVRAATAATDTELAASDDNPLVSIADGRLISNGNFHPMVLALAFDALRPALAHVGQASDRRMSHLWGLVMASGDAVTPAGMRGILDRTRGPLLRYAAATRYAELRAMAGPVTLDVPPLDLGVEDHATNAPEAVRCTDDALDILEQILMAELLLARAALVLADRQPGVGIGTRVALGWMAGVLADHPGAMTDEVAAALQARTREELLPLVRSAVASP